MVEETRDEIALKLVWLSQWKIQQESAHTEPTLPRMIGHLSVHSQVTQYIQDHDVSKISASESMQDVHVSQVEDIMLGKDDDATVVIDEFSHLLTHMPTDITRATQSISSGASSVVVKEVEVDPDDEENPFSSSDDDEEEISSHGGGDEDIFDWSSEEDTEFGSVSSVEDEIDREHGIGTKLPTIAEETGDDMRLPSGGNKT